MSERREEMRPTCACVFAQANIVFVRLAALIVSVFHRAQLVDNTNSNCTP